MKKIILGLVLLGGLPFMALADEATSTPDGGGMQSCQIEGTCPCFGLVTGYGLESCLDQHKPKEEVQVVDPNIAIIAGLSQQLADLQAKIELYQPATKEPVKVIKSVKTAVKKAVVAPTPQPEPQRVIDNPTPELQPIAPTSQPETPKLSFWQKIWNFISGK